MDLQRCFISFEPIGTTPDHVSIHPRPPKGMKYRERKEKFTPAVLEMLAKLQAAGLKAKRDGLTVYVFQK